MSDVKIGELVVGDQQKDAIHVAVIPMAAAEKLKPGQRVGIISNGVAGPKAAKIIGIVDPFLTKPVKQGERFWLALLPGTVTGMRHHWLCDDFTIAEAAADENRKDVAEMWLRAYAVKMNPYIDDHEDAFKHLINCLKDRELFASGTDLHGLYELDDADELKRNAEIYLGISINWGEFTFTCSC